MSDEQNDFLKQFKITAAMATASILIAVGGSIINTHFKTRQLEVDISKKADREIVELKNDHIVKELSEIKLDVREIKQELKQHTVNE